MENKKFEKALASHLDELIQFSRSKINDRELAADLVQESLLKAIRAQDSLKDKSNIRAWLYSILRNSIIDLYRKKSIIKDDTVDPEMLSYDELDRQACSCMEKLLPTLNKDYAYLVKELELNQKPTSLIRRQLNISENNLKVKRHRARQQLKKRLQETCKLCAIHGCLDCSCGQTEQKSKPRNS